MAERWRWRCRWRWAMRGRQAWRGRHAARASIAMPLLLLLLLLLATGLSGTIAARAAVQPDLGPRRPEEPPATRYAGERLAARLAADQASLMRARRAAVGEAADAVDAAIALRRTLRDLAGAEAPGRRPDEGSLVLAASIAHELAAWDRVLRRAVDGPTDPGADVDADAEATRRFTRVLTEGAGEGADVGADAGTTTDARSRLAAAVRELHRRPVAMPRAAREEVSTADAAAALDAAIRAAGWLGAADDVLVPHRAGSVGPGGAAVLQRAASVIGTINEIAPTARRRARLRAAVGQLAAAWPADAAPEELAEIDRGWRRLGGIAESAARRRALAGRVAPAELGVDLRRLTGLLVQRAEAAELAVIDRVDDLLLGAGPTRDPALVSLVVGFRRAVENLDRLHQRAAWIAAVAAIDPGLEEAAAGWIDEQLLRLGAPARRVQASRRLEEFDDLLGGLVASPGLQRMDDPSPSDRALVGNRTREVADAVRRAGRERLALAFGGEAAPAAGSLGTWNDLLAIIDVVARAREAREAGGDRAAASHPDWFIGVSADELVDRASRAVDVAVDRALDGRADSGGGPPADAVAMARARVALVAAWLAAAEERGESPADPAMATLPASMIAATRASTMPGLSRLSSHAVEAAAAAAAGDEDAAEAHRAMAIWIASTDFDPTNASAAWR